MPFRPLKPLEFGDILHSKIVTGYYYLFLGHGDGSTVWVMLLTPTPNPYRPGQVFETVERVIRTDYEVVS